jgi:hypothetical protein
MSSASSSGSSIAAKCPPLGISVQRLTSKKRSAQSRGAVTRSSGTNLANNHATYRRSEAWQNAFAG